MKHATLIAEAEQILYPSLAALNYLLVVEPPSAPPAFWFEKKVLDGTYRIIEVQPSGFDKDHIHKIAVNLARRSFQDFHDPRNYLANQPEFHVRLAPCLWETEVEKKAMDQWWHFDDSLEGLRSAYEDILEKLVNYGIPFLENPESSWWIWAGQEPPK